MTSCNVLHLTGEGARHLSVGVTTSPCRLNELSILTDPAMRGSGMWPPPVKGATDLPAQLYHDHADAIAHGVAACSMPSQTDPGLTLSVQGTTELSSSRVGAAPAGSKEHSAPTQVEFPHNPPRKHSFF